MRIRWLTAFFLAASVLLFTGAALANPTPGTGTCGKPYCYWETPMDISDPETIWNVLIQPMTVVDGNERTQVLLYQEPDEESQPVGEVTCHSQGVHVLETLENGWSLVECYSSSNGVSQLEIFNDLVRGYIPTEQLKEKETKTKFGLVVDKLIQRMYVFQEGKLLTTLRVSTGKANERDPQRETNAGEFHLVSFIGDFVSDNTICEHGIRFNDGDLLHNVPYVLGENGKKEYWNFERRLGQRASAGCIRVQRWRTPEGINMQWLWNRMFNMKQTKLLIWEDAPGRQLAAVPEDTPVYVLPGLSNAYHKKDNCFDIDQCYFPLQQITYAQLDEEEFSHLKDCSYCNPPLRREQIEEINRQYALETEE